MSNILYLECFSGVSGDMSVAALLDLGADIEVLIKGLQSLKVDGFKIEIGRSVKSGIDACDFNVILDEQCDHSHDHIHNHIHEHNGVHSHDHIYDHSHDNHIEHSNEHNHEHIHRNLQNIIDIIDGSEITGNAKNIAKKIFHVVARAEAKAHGIDIEKVHFHEVGAVDSIVDIVGVAICLDNLNITEVVVSELYEGQGYSKCQHGLMPVPVPAVINIVEENGLDIRITENRGEMITPTGAAIVAAIKTIDKLPESYKIRKIGLGAGKKEFKNANILRAFLIEPKDNDENITVIECNVDDMTGEELGFAMERLLESGAKDVFFTPIYMKKNRPAYMVKVLCEKAAIENMTKNLFKYTSTIGVRYYDCKRTVMNRSVEEINTSIGKVRAKVCQYKDIVRNTIEYDDAREIALKSGMSLNEVFKTIYKEI